MQGSRRLSLMVGAFVLLCLGALAAAILSLTSEGIFRPQYKLVAHFSNVLGLLPGAPVWLSGKAVGHVDAISFEAVGAEQPLRVELTLDSEVMDRVRTDSTASIGTIGVLGDSYIEISVGTLEGEVLTPGSELVTVDPVNLNAMLSKVSDVVETGGVALESISDLAQNLDAVITGFSENDGGRKAAAAVAAVSDIVVAIKEDSGLLHSLIYDPYDGGGVESIERSLEALESILHEIRDGEGILHSLVYDTVADQDVVMEVVEAGARMNSILAKIDRGDGTLGMFLNDPTLYEDLKILLGGAQRSTVVRSLISLSVDRQTSN